jgi:hypothetical protein
MVANSLCTTLLRLAKSFVLYLIHISILTLKLGISENLCLLLRSVARAAAVSAFITYVLAAVSTFPLMLHGDRLNM